MNKNNIIVTCAKGITPFLITELQALGFTVDAQAPAFVETRGTMEDAMRLNLHIRTGQRVLFLVKEFLADTPDELYDSLIKIEWEDYLYADGYLCVTSSIDNPVIKNTQFANVKCKDAIVDRIREKKGRRPDSGPLRDSAVVHLFWKNSRCAVYIDTSGEPLHIRGYRKIQLKAPMQESLAAAVVLATNWRGDLNLINPMCGSGTLAVEALLIALNRAPGLMRKNFGFMHIKGFRRDRWDALLAEAKAVVKKTVSGRVIASDISPEAVESARRNAALAGVEQLIEFICCDYGATPVPEGGGVIILNPPYGERMGDAEKLKTLYREMGDFFKQKCGGYEGYIFTGNIELAKSVGLKARRRIPFFNGAIECRLLQYELYSGTRRAEKGDD